MGQMATCTIADPLTLIARFISYEKWMQREKSVGIRHVYLRLAASDQIDLKSQICV